jgi:hypothetical protein
LAAQTALQASLKFYATQVVIGKRGGKAKAVKFSDSPFAFHLF